MITFQLSATPSHPQGPIYIFIPPSCYDLHFIFSSGVYTITTRLASHISSPRFLFCLNQLLSASLFWTPVLWILWILVSLCYLLLSPLSRTSLSLNELDPLYGFFFPSRPLMSFRNSYFHAFMSMSHHEQPNEIPQWIIISTTNRP